MWKVVTSVVPYFATDSSGFSRWGVVSVCPILFAYFAKGWVMGTVDATDEAAASRNLIYSEQRRMTAPTRLVKPRNNHTGPRMSFL